MTVFTTVLSHVRVVGWVQKYFNLTPSQDNVAISSVVVINLAKTCSHVTIDDFDEAGEMLFFYTKVCRILL